MRNRWPWLAAPGLFFVLLGLWFFSNQGVRHGAEAIQTAEEVSEASTPSPAGETPATGNLADDSIPVPSMPDPARKVEIPAPDASAAEVMSFREKLAQGYQPVDPQASRNFPASEEFVLAGDSPDLRLHAALNEAFVPGEQGVSEILEFPPAENLEDWQNIVQRISPNAELVLYHPGSSRTDGNAKFLGTSFILEAPSEEEARAEAERNNWRFLKSLGLGGPFLVAATTPTQALQILRGTSGVNSSRIAGNFRRIAQKRFIPNDPLFPSQWHLRSSVSNTVGFPVDLNITSAWDSVRGSNVVVGIADDGLEVTHPDLAQNVASGLHFNWRGGPTDDPSPRSSGDFHGTAVAGLVAGRGNNSIGISGAAPAAKLAGLSVLNANTATDADLIAMLKWKPNDIAIKNMSYSTSLDNGTGFGTISSSVKEALAWATENGRQGRGTILVQANGNGNSQFVFGSQFGVYTFPFYSADDSQWDEFANSIRVISVAAIGQNGLPADYTEHGANISVAAPSSRTRAEDGYLSGLVTTGLGGTYRSQSNPFGGTSGSAALVSGVAALLLEANPTLGWRDVKQILMQTARQPSSTFRGSTIENKTGKSFSYVFGAGLVDAEAAVVAAAEHQNLPPMMTASKSAKVELLPKYGDSNGVSTTLTLNQAMRVESVALTFSAQAVINFYTLVLYIKSPSGTEVRMNCLRGTTGGVEEGKDIVFSTPFFWGEPGAGTWTIRAVDEAPGGGIPGRIFKTVSSVALTWYGSSAPPTPPNDPFNSPDLLTGNRGSVSVNNTGASRQTKEGEPNHAGGKGGGSLWWRFEPNTSGFLTLDTSASQVKDTLLAAYSGTALTNLLVMASNDDISVTNLRSRLSRLPVEAGKGILIAVDGKNRERGTIQLDYFFESGALYDNFAEPKTVTGTSWTDAGRNNGSTPAYSAESGEKPHAGQTAFRSVWYRWTPGVTGTAEITTTNVSFPTVLAVYQGSSVNALTPIASNAGTSSRNTSRVQFGVRPGQTYHVAVDGRSRRSGSFTVQGFIHGAPPLAGTNRPPTTPTNQLTTNALTLAGASVSTNGNNLSAAKGSSGGPSVWYKWTAPKSGMVSLNTSGSGFDTMLAAYTEAMVNKGSNDNARSGVRWSQVSFQADAGTTYMIEVSGARGSSGRFKLNLRQ